MVFEDGLNFVNGGAAVYKLMVFLIVRSGLESETQNGIV
jgi:hypothetical protein